MNKIAKLFTEESVIVFTNGNVIKGSVDVGEYMVKVINKTFAYGVNRGLKIGFIGGIATSVVAHKYYMRKKSNSEEK